MHMDQIHYFLSVAETHSITQSAVQLCISPQGLSRSIASLEKEYDIVLFTRTTSGMALTDKGRQFVEYANSIWGAYCRFEQSVARLAAETDGLGNESIDLIVSPVITVGDLLPAILSELSNSFPQIEVTVSEVNSYDMVEIARSMDSSRARKSIMLASVPEYRLVEYLPSERYTATVLLKFPMVARMDEHHPLAKRRYVTCADLVKEDIVCFNEPVIVEIVHHLLDGYGGPKFVFKGSVRNLIGRFPDAVSIAGALAPVKDDSVVSVPIKDSVMVDVLGVISDPSSAAMRQVLDHVAKALSRFLNSK